MTSLVLLDEAQQEAWRRRQHRISVTERGEFKRCRRRWDYGSKSRQNLAPTGTPRPALQLGSLIHQSLAEWILNPKAQLDAIFMKFAQDELKRITSAYEKIVGCKPSDEELGSFYENVGLGHAMLINYQLRWITPLPEEYKFVSPEQAIEIPIPGTGRTCTDCSQENSTRDSCLTCLGGGWVHSYLTATLDGLVQDEEGYLYILEHKTYGQRPNLDSLDSNDQFLGYIWTALQMNIGPVGGILYDGMWKRAKPPAKATFEDLFLRKRLQRNLFEVTEFGTMLAQEALEMASNPALYTNHRWEGCYDCSFVKLCNAQSKGEDFEYVRKTFYGPRDTSGEFTDSNEVESASTTAPF